MTGSAGANTTDGANAVIVLVPAEILVPACVSAARAASCACVNLDWTVTTCADGVPAACATVTGVDGVPAACVAANAAYVAADTAAASPAGGATVTAPAVTAGGADTAPAAPAGGATVTAGGATVTAGGATVTAGGATVTAGGATASISVYLLHFINNSQIILYLFISL